MPALDIDDHQPSSATDVPRSKRLLLEATADDLRGLACGAGPSCVSSPAGPRWVIRRRAESFDAMSDLPLALRRELEDEWAIFSTRVAFHGTSPDGTDKLLLECHDRRRIECVLMASRSASAYGLHQHPGRLRHGLRLLRQRPEGRGAEPDAGRDRRAGAPAAQPAAARRDAITHIVVMGMGESLANLDNLIALLDRLCSPRSGLGLSHAGQGPRRSACPRRSASWPPSTGNTTWPSPSNCAH